MQFTQQQKDQNLLKLKYEKQLQYMTIAVIVMRRDLQYIDNITDIV